jgi:hypothetical protein
MMFAAAVIGYLATFLAVDFFLTALAVLLVIPLGTLGVVNYFRGCVGISRHRKRGEQRVAGMIALLVLLCIWIILSPGAIVLLPFCIFFGFAFTPIVVLANSGPENPLTRPWR